MVLLRGAYPEEHPNHLPAYFLCQYLAKPTPVPGLRRLLDGFAAL